MHHFTATYLYAVSKQHKNEVFASRVLHLYFPQHLCGCLLGFLAAVYVFLTVRPNSREVFFQGTDYALLFV